MHDPSEHENSTGIKEAKKRRNWQREPARAGAKHWGTTRRVICASERFQGRADIIMFMERPEGSNGNVLERLDDRLARQPWWSIVALSLLLTVVIGGVDYLTGHDFEMTIFYLLPILLTTWYFGRLTGIGLACAATLVSFTANWAAFLSQLNWAVRLWNAALDLSSFVIIILLFAAWKQQNRALEVAASQDALTGLANRRTFYEMAQLELGRSKRYDEVFTIAYLDADDFKQVNDSYGHAAGDELLRQAAAALRQHTRQIDTVARLGGDEFAILLPTTDETGARKALTKLQLLLAEAMSRQRWSVTFSLGAVTFRQPCASVDDLMCKVDEVIYQVKRRGKNGLALSVWPDGSRPAANQL